MKKFIGLIGLIGLIGPIGAFATDYSATSFKVIDPVIEPGAGFATSAGFQLWSSLGQNAIGLSDALSFTLKSGFLYFPAPSSSATPTPALPGAGGGGPPILYRPLLPIGKSCDFSGDDRCNIVDLSILLYWFDQSGPAIAPYDLNEDGKLDIVDLSVLLFYWV